MTDQPTARDERLDQRLLEAYVARVRTLSAADWGRLDAIAVRLSDHTPWARLRRARIDADRYRLFAQLVPRPVAVGGAAVIRAANEVGRWLGTQPARDPFAPPRRHVHSPTDPRLPEMPPEVREREAWRERWIAGIAELRRVARAAPAARRATDGGAGALWVLEAGYLALRVRRSDPGAAERLYALVEPVVPLASLDGTQPRLTVGS